ncbi:hypothetical protein K435DRAFT_876387 [Dendrothele bispora CBS 962.96]|uniref:Uncharacterized protein n=1 Tax=Dendrothele bispora (strain CBS 962.96) TaxID=1314807 RepID=A0A4S8KTC3_DENBC|nr:hypothetical protein K435DRAFT_876387 [Dendrothele bispora CBS 962.96]
MHPLKGVNNASFTRITRSISKQDHPFLLLSDSFDLNQAIQRVVTFQLADIPSSPPSSRCQTPTPSSNGVVISSTQSSPLSSLPSSRSQSPISCDPVPSNPPHSDDSKSQVNTPGRKRRRRKRGSRDQTVSAPLGLPTNASLTSLDKQKKSTLHLHRNRQKKRKLNKNPTEYQARPKAVARTLETANPLHVTDNAFRFAGTSSGYLGKDFGGEDQTSYSIEDMQAKGFQVYEWDGKESVPIVDSQERIIALLAGNPVNDLSWPAIIEEAARELEDAREQLIVDKEAQEHRRGKYVVASVGNSIGGGQKHPMPFKQHPANDPVIQRLLSSKPFERLAGWALSAHPL